MYCKQCPDSQSSYPNKSKVLIQINRALSFLLLEGAWDKVILCYLERPFFQELSFEQQAYEWMTLTDAQRSLVKSQYAAAGVKLVVSVFGSTDVPTSTGADPFSTANTVAAWVKRYQLDGVDVDYEVNIFSLRFRHTFRP